MLDIVVVTNEDLEEQRLLDGTDIRELIKEPRDGIDSRILNLLARANIVNYFIEFDGVKVPSRRTGAYPNPTMSHFVLARYLKNNDIKSKKVLDLGCGLGFLGNYGAKFLDPEVVVFSDLSEIAINQAFEAYQRNNEDFRLVRENLRQHRFGFEIKTERQTLDLRIGDSARTLENYDAEGCVSLCAPYFIPGVCEVFPGVFSLFAGVAKSTGSKLYIGHTNLASSLVEKAAQEHGLKLNSKVEKRVPFLIEYTDGRDKRICDSLVSEGLEIAKNGIAYHKLMVSELSLR